MRSHVWLQVLALPKWSLQCILPYLPGLSTMQSESSRPSLFIASPILLCPSSTFSRWPFFPICRILYIYMFIYLPSFRTADTTGVSLHSSLTLSIIPSKKTIFRVHSTEVTDPFPSDTLIPSWAPLRSTSVLDSSVSPSLVSTHLTK